MRALLSVTLLTLCGAAAPAAAATAVTEAELLARAADHPAFAAFAAEGDLAAADLLRARLLDDPVLAAEAERPGDEEHQTTVTATWQLPRRARGARIAAASARLEAAEAGAAARRLALELELLELYADWWAAAERARLLEEHGAHLDRLARRARARADAGEASGLEADRLALSAETVRAEAAVTAAAAAELERRVAGWLPSDGPFRPAAPVLSALDAAPGNRADLEALRRRTAAAAADVAAARRVIDTPALTLGWQRAATGDATADGPVLGLAWTVPLLDRNRAERAAAATAERLAAAELAAAERAAEASRAGAGAAYRTLADRVAELARGAADPESVAAAVAEAFLLGEASVTDLLETLDTTLDARLARVDLHRAAAAARNRLAAALGRLPGGIS